MNLAEALSALYARVPLGMRLGLDPMKAACARAGHPERAFRAVHVAGTNGKGSTCAMIESIARASGLRTGLYTSPHLCRFAERIRLDGAPLSDEALTGVLERALAIGHDLSFFETATLAAFLAFAEAKVDLAVVEVGLGGRLDATNVLPAPEVSAVTSIGLDHTDKLGTTLAAIASEKASIAKAGTRMVVGRLAPEAHEVVVRVAREAGAEIVSVVDRHDSLDAMQGGLPGGYQADNLEVAYQIAKLLGFDAATIARGVRAATWPGRFERIETPDGPYLLDGAHNPDGAAALANSLRSARAEPAALVFGAMGDKDWHATQDLLAPLTRERVYVAPQGRAPASPDELARRHPGALAPSVAEALRAARARAGAGLVLVTGSLYLVGEARSLLLDLPRDPPVAL